MTLKDRLLRPFKGWIPFELSEKRKTRRGFRILTNKKTIITLSSILIMSIVVWQMTPIPPPIPPITPIKPAFLATSEFGGRLRIWDYNYSSGEYEVLWSAESMFYDSIAMGDVNNDGKKEVLGTKTRKGLDGTYYEIIFEVYNEVDSYHWERIKSNGQMEGVKEDQKYKNHEIVVADVDGEPGNEVIMKTHHWLVVYKYSEVEGDFKKLSSTNPFVDGKTVTLESLIIRDIDRDGINEILVSANEEENENKGYLLIYQDFSLTGFVIVPINAHLGPSIQYYVELGNKFRHNSLRVGDLEGDGSIEICSSGYRKESNVSRKWYEGGAFRLEGDLYEVYLFIWDSNGNLLHEIFVYEVHYWDLPTLTFDIGDVDPNHVGDEIAYWFRLGTEEKGSRDYEYNKLTLSYFEESKLNELWSTTTDGGRNLYITDSNGDGENDIVLGGRKNCFYLEIFDENGDTLWKRLKEEVGEGDVMYIASG